MTITITRRFKRIVFGALGFFFIAQAYVHRYQWRPFVDLNYSEESDSVGLIIRIANWAFMFTEPGMVKSFGEHVLSVAIIFLLTFCCALAVISGLRAIVESAKHFLCIWRTYPSRKVIGAPILNALVKVRSVLTEDSYIEIPHRSSQWWANFLVGVAGLVLVSIILLLVIRIT